MRGILTLLLLSSVFLDVFGQEELAFSLDDCINYALQNNEQLEIARFENDIAVTQINETLARGLPQVNGNIGVTKNFKIQTSFIQDFISPAVYGVLINESLLPNGTTIPEPQTFPAAFGTEYSGIAGITARQLIFDGSFFVGLQAAQTVKLLSERQQKLTEVEVVENISKAYYLVLIAKENVEYLGRDFQTLDTLLLETKAMYENGFVEKLDVARLQIQHNNLRTNLKNNTELLVTSLNLLKFQMGMPIDQRMTLTGSITDAESQITNDDLDQNAAYANRPEYDVLQTNKDLIALNIKNFKSQYVPNIYANFNYGWTAGTNTFGDLTTFDNSTWFRYSNLGVSISIPIFDGLSKRANIQRNQIQMKQLEQTMEQFRNNVSREVIEAKIKAENAKRNVETQTENVALAREVYEITKIKYQEGVGANLEVVDANTSLKQAQTNYLNALYEAITSQIELKKSLGTLYKQ